jgi:hypothetical protein
MVFSSSIIHLEKALEVQPCIAWLLHEHGQSHLEFHVVRRTVSTRDLFL